jgi:uncharacterized membrane protein YbhN (UPF0104 family)
MSAHRAALLRLLSLAMLAGGAALAAVALHGRVDALLDACARIGTGAMLAALALTLLSLQLRFARWQLYLRAQGHALPRLLHQRLFAAGFAFALTPAAAGEAARALLLRRRGVRYAHSVAALLAERLSDLFALLLLAALLRAWLLAAALALAAPLLVAARRARRWPVRLRRLRRALQRCHAPALLARANALGLAAWIAEALAFHAIATQLGLALALPDAAGIYAAALLAGALSTSPGGIGGTEATMVALLVGRGAGLPDALAAALLTRLATLGLTVLVGGVSLASLRLRPAAELDAAPLNP